jgi:predicted protein tyrosine phosphatase
MLIEVMSLEEASDVLCSREACGELACLISIGEPYEELPAGYENVVRRLRLNFADTVAGAFSPTEDDVRQIIELAEVLRSSSGRVLIHCAAGISRSSAAALIMHACWLGPGREREALTRVLAQRPIARPNRRMVALADKLLERRGRLSAVVDELFYEVIAP